MFPTKRRDKKAANYKEKIVMAKFSVTGDQYFKIDGIMLDIKRQLRTKSGSPLDPEKVIAELQKANEPEVSAIDPRFEFLMEFKVTVPTDYDHGMQLNTLKKKEFYYFNDEITDRNFRKATQKLVPGKTYKAKLFSIKGKVNSDDCLGLYKAVGAILTGVQGMSLVYQLKKDVLPKGKCAVSFDEKDALWQDSVGRRRVPFVLADSGGDFKFYLGDFEVGWDSDSVVLCLCDCDE